MAQRHSLLQAMRRGQAALVAAGLLACSLARADVAIDIEGVDEALRNNVIAHLSLSRYRERDLDADTLERLHNRVDREVKAALRPFGYYEPIVESKLENTRNGDARLVIRIDPGPPVILDTVDVKVSGPGSDDRLFRRITRRLPLRPGERLSHASYEEVKADLQRTATTYGYLDAKLKRSELRVDPEQRTASVALELETGQRYRFGTTSIEQDVIDDTLVRRFMRYEQDEPFDVTELLRTQFALDDSLYFSTVEVLPGEPDRSELTVPVSIRAAPNRRQRFSFGAGYGSDTGPRGTAIWEHRRVNTHGHRFNVELEAAEVSQTLESRYIVPIGDPALEKLTLELVAEQRELADLDTETLSIEPSITRVRGRWQRVLFVTATRTITQSAVARQDDTLLIPGVNLASIPQGYLGEPLFGRGFFAELRGSHNIFGSDSDFIQLLLQSERVFDISRRWHLLLRGELGSSLVAQFSQLPGAVRFFAGGDRSVRGFGYNELSPVQIVENDDGTTERVKVGGRHLMTGSFEVVRDLPRRMGVAAFFDFGNAFDDFGKAPDPEDSDFLEYSAGLGFRWRLPVVTVGFDIAQPLSEPGAGPRLHINFSPRL